MKLLFPIAFALLGSKLLFSLLGFEYKVLTDPFNLVYFIIDVGVFIALWWVGELLVKRFTSSNADSASEG